MTHIFIILMLLIFLIFLVKLRLVQVDLFFPWFISLIVLGLVSTKPEFVNWLGSKLGILYAPIAVLFLVIFLLIGIIVTLTISVTRLRSRQVSIIRKIAALELEKNDNNSASE